MAYNQGNTLFTGDYANPNTPLWLSALNPTSPPANITVSSLTAAPSGGVLLASSGTLPNADYGEVSFNRASGGAVTATQLTQNVSHAVPTKGADSDYLTVATQNHTVYDDLALAGLQIFGQQVTNPLANTGAAGYLHQGAVPFSVTLDTGLFTTGDIKTSRATVSTLTVSSLTDIANFNVDTLRASTVYGNTLNSAVINTSSFFGSTIGVEKATFSSITAQIVNASTLAVSTFSLLNNALISTIGVSTLTAGNANMQNVSTGVFSAGVANISTLITAGGGVVASTISSKDISSITATLKEIFVSTMVFNATVSPKLDLGLGGIVGGIVGALGANALSVGLGAAGLGTGIAGLAMARQYGGINPTVFQTINGTSQLQFSTLGQATNTIFTLTNALDYTHVPGSTIYTSTIIPANSRAVRTVSDPINLANSDGATGLGIQGFSQWEPVYPGGLQVGTSSLTMAASGNGGNYIELDNINGVGFMDITAVQGLGVHSPNIYLDTGFSGIVSIVNTLDVYGTILAGKISTISSIQGPKNVPVGIYPGIVTSTLTVSSLVVNTVTQPNFSASSITTGTLSVTNSAAVSQTVRLATNGGQLGSLGVFIGQTVLNPPLDGNSLSVQRDIQADSLNIRSIISNQGDLFVLGATQLKTTNTSTLSAGLISTASITANVMTTPLINATNLTGLGMTPYPPSNGSYGQQWGTFVIAGFRITWGITNGNRTYPFYSTASFTPNFGQAPLIFLTSLTYGNVPSWWSVVDRQVNGFTSLGLNEPGLPFATQCQYVAIGPA